MTHIGIQSLLKVTHIQSKEGFKGDTYKVGFEGDAYQIGFTGDKDRETGAESVAREGGGAAVSEFTTDPLGKCPSRATRVS